MATTKVMPNPLDFRDRWLEEHARKVEAHALFARHTLDAFKGSTSTPYARSVLELAEAHEEAAAVYRRRIEELQ